MNQLSPTQKALDLREALAKQEILRERLEGALKGGRLALFDWNIITGEVYTNDYWLGMLGYTRDDHEPTFDTWEKLVHPDDIGSAHKALTDHLEGNSDWYMTIVRMRHKSGDWHHINCSGEVMEWDSEGKPTRMLGTHRDVTHDIELKESYKKAALKAQRAARIKSEFLSNMSHEIRTPLNGIMGMLDLLEHEEDPEIKASFLEAAKECSATLKTIIDGMLDLGRLEAGALEIKNIAFDPCKVLGNTATLLRPSAEKKGLIFNYALEKPDGKLIIGDPARMTQIVYNLLGNAIKFTDTGRVQFNAYFEDIVSEAEETRCVLIIEDTGIGISSEQLARIFGRFEQLDTGYTKKRQGVGLGLSIVEQLVSQMGGTIHVTSELGEGARFVVKIPVKKAGDFGDNHPAETFTRNQDVEKNKLKILVVEDNVINLQIMAGFLKHLGIAFKKAADGVEAVKVTKSENFDIILMDISMPTMDGTEATAIIREENNPNRETPIIAVTASIFPEDIKAFKNAGMNGVISKPFQLEDIKHKINLVLSDPLNPILFIDHS